MNLGLSGACRRHAVRRRDSGTPSYLNPQNVSTLFWEIGVQRTARPTNSRAFAFVGRVRHSVRAGEEKHRSPVNPPSYHATARHVKNCRGCENFYGLDGGVGRGRGEGVDLGAAVAVGVAVAVAVGVGLGVAPPHIRISS